MPAGPPCLDSFCLDSYRGNVPSVAAIAISGTQSTAAAINAHPKLIFLSDELSAKRLIRATPEKILAGH